MSKIDLESFEQQGYLVVEDVIDRSAILEPIITAYTEKVNELSETWHREGRLERWDPDLSVEEQLAAVTSAGVVEVARHLDISLPDGELDENTDVFLTPAVFELLTCPALLDVVEAVVGSEILSNPVQHVRIKPPESAVRGELHQNFLLRQTGWHQDQGVIRPDADATNLLTVWVPVRDTDERNGCLQVIPGSHRQGLSPHCPGQQGLTIPESELGGAPIPLPVEAGSVILLHRLTRHASLPNVSDRARWSFDLRYQPVGQPTGRDEFPAFVVRSARDPDSVLDSFEAWRELWETARRSLLHSGERPRKHRWPDDAPICA